MTRSLGRHLHVRLVVAGEEVARVLVLALRPDLARPVGDVLVGREEVEARRGVRRGSATAICAAVDVAGTVTRERGAVVDVLGAAFLPP